MELSRDDVREVLRVLDSSGLDELHLELSDLTLTVRREGATGWTAEQQVLRQPVLEGRAESKPTGAEAAPEVGADAGSARAAVAAGLTAVHPPLPGTFYRAPKPGAAPFVDVGDEVAEDTVVGIVETMKMMTPVHAGVRGTVVEFRVDNAEFADSETVLLVVDPRSGTAEGAP
jgi:acetyl-CoA carboxylase biotin carboxyl carrier protein